MVAPAGTRARLEQHRVSCLARLEAMGALEGERLPSEFVDAAAVQRDRASALTERIALREVIRACADALLLFDAGLYGQCTQCSDEIPEARLIALPWAVRCLGCQASLETIEAEQRPNSRRVRRISDDDDEDAA